MFRLPILFLIILFTFQGGQKEVKGEFSFDQPKKTESKKASTLIDLKSRGVGPIDSVKLNPEIDMKMAAKGKELFEQKCVACHKVGSTFIGPAPNGILKRRTPEWVMNMILNPTEMLEKDSLAKALFMEFNGQLMTDQKVQKAEARAILEFFRTLED